MNEDGNSHPRNVTTEARQFAANGAYAIAFDMYIAGFEKYPELKARLEPEFRVLLAKLNELIVKTNKIGDLFNNFERAVKAYPDNKYILNDIGNYLYKYRYFSEACCHFQKALNVDPGYVAAEKNLNNIKNFLVERWHFRMLNDKIRNESYRRAIKETIGTNGSREFVLDLGAGTGLLTMYACECKVVTVTAVDASPTMTDIAKKVTDEEPFVIVVTKMSTSLDYQDIAGRRSLIITEVFDAGLFGENILQTLLHAWEYLISKVGRILPLGAEFFVAGVKSDQLNLKHRLSTAAKTALNIETFTVHVSTLDPYDCEDVHLIKDLSFMTKPESVVQVDFNNVEDIKEKLYKIEPYEVKLTAIETGEITTVVGWFDLKISKNITISTNPNYKNRANAWQQAVFFDYKPHKVIKGETVPVQFTSEGGKLALAPFTGNQPLRISSDMMRFLNDADYMNLIAGSIGTACIYLGQLTDISQTNLVDLCPFPVFGMLMMKRGAHSLTCYAKNREDKKFFKKVFKANKVPISKITILIGQKLNQEAFGDQKFHLIYNNLIDLCGDLNIELNELATHLCLANLIQGGLVLPHLITLEAQLVNSRWLDTSNRVKDENCSGIAIGVHLNKFQVSQNIHIDLAQLPYVAISEPVTVAVIDDEMKSLVISVPIENDGEVNAIICWYTITLVKGGEQISTNRANSFIDSMAFLMDPAVPMKAGDEGHILRCVDPDGAFKLIFDSAA